VPEEQKQDLLQLYRFCFLMLADAAKAQEIFHATLREAAQLAADTCPEGKAAPPLIRLDGTTLALARPWP